MDFIIMSSAHSPEMLLLKSASFGISDLSYYDLLAKALYPNAPDKSLACFELCCVHSTALNDVSIRNQVNLLMGNLSRKKRGQ